MEDSQAAKISNYTIEQLREGISDHSGYLAWGTNYMA